MLHLFNVDQQLLTMKKRMLFLLFLSLFFQSNADQWEQRADFGSIGRHRTTAINIGTKIYMGLGHFNGTGIETYFNDWWEYDPATNSWTQKANYIGNFGNGELGAHGIGLETIGFVGLGEFEKTKLYKFDPATNSWSFASNAPAGTNFQDTGDFTIGHKAYFTRLSSSNFYEYDTDLDIWTLKNPTPFTTVYSWNGFSINGKGYAKIYNLFWEYNPATDLWTSKSTFPGLAKLSSIAFVQNNMGYIICGYNSTYGDVTNEVWEYDPALDIWNQLPDFPGTSRRYSSGVSVGNRCFLGTGTNGTNFNDFWEFNRFADVEDFSIETSFQTYPNPCKDVVTFRSDKINAFDVTIYGPTGEKVGMIHVQNGLGEFDLDKYPSGVYYYSISVKDSILFSNTLVVL